MPLGGQRRVSGSGPGRKISVAGGTAIVYAGTLADASVSGATGSLSLTPRDNVTPENQRGGPITDGGVTLKWRRYPLPT